MLGDKCVKLGELFTDGILIIKFLAILINNKDILASFECFFEVENPDEIIDDFDRLFVDGFLYLLFYTSE